MSTPTEAYIVIVADTAAQAEQWARYFYGRSSPRAVEVGGSRDGRKTFRVYGS